MKKIYPLFFLFLQSVCSVGIAESKTYSGTVHIAGIITVPTCQSFLSRDNVTLVCNKVIKDHAGLVSSGDKGNDSSQMNYYSAKVDYINSAHTLGVLSINYR